VFPKICGDLRDVASFSYHFISVLLEEPWLLLAKYRLYLLLAIKNIIHCHLFAPNSTWVLANWRSILHNFRFL